MARRLKITKSTLQNVNYQYLGAYRLRVDISDPSSSGADPYVFLYLQRPINPYDQTQSADFLGIASPVDFAEYPVGEPRDGTTYPIFRLDYIELDFRSTVEANETWTSVVSEVSNLLLALNRMERLVPVEELWVGAPPEGASESSSSSSSG